MSNDEPNPGPFANETYVRDNSETSHVKPSEKRTSRGEKTEAAYWDYRIILREGKRADYDALT